MHNVVRRQTLGRALLNLLRHSFTIVSFIRPLRRLHIIVVGIVLGFLGFSFLHTFDLSNKDRVEAEISSSEDLKL